MRWPVEAALTPSEIEPYEEHFRPLVESGTGTIRWAYAYLSAVKRPDPSPSS